MSNPALLSKIMNRLSAGDRFPSILMKDTEDKTVCIPEKVNTKYLPYFFSEEHGDPNAPFSWKGTENTEYFLKS